MRTGIMATKISISTLCFSLVFAAVANANPGNPEKPAEQIPAVIENAAPNSPTEVGPKTIPASGEQSTAPSAVEPPHGTPLNWRRAKQQELSAIAPDPSGNVHNWESGAHKSYLIPALEVPGFLGLLNMYDRIVYPDQTEDGKKVYSSTFSSTWDHLRKQNWVFDKDPVNINQFSHPYQGATM